MKYPEGQDNKAFLLTFDDKSELVAKLPSPNAGPPILTTASEVATMEFESRRTHPNQTRTLIRGRHAVS
jgi:hypothetical protein